jgi:hypothetical protein
VRGCGLQLIRETRLRDMEEEKDLDREAQHPSTIQQHLSSGSSDMEEGVGFCGWHLNHPSLVEANFPSAPQ